MILDSIIWEAGLDMIYLSACALHGTIPDKDIVGSMDLPSVYKQAARHHMRSITCMALEEASDAVDTELLQAWRKNKLESIKRVFSYAVEREQLYRFFDENQIWYMPMKGIIMQDLYPKMGMREMVDNDILIDKDYRKTVREYMENRGYTTDYFGKGCHDVYLLSPLYNFELHVYLSHQSETDKFYEYYLDVKDRLIRDNDKHLKYHFNDEDFYIYMIVHGFKHFARSGGVGIRMLMDTAVYNMRFPQLDREYIAGELKKINIHEFEEKVRALAAKVFSPDCPNLKNDPELLSEEERTMLDFFIESGSFGKMGEKLKQKLTRVSGKDEITFGTKVKYFLKRLFPTGLYFEENYPFLHKYKFFIPFFWIFRLVTKPFTSTRIVVNEIRLLFKQK